MLSSIGFWFWSCFWPRLRRLVLSAFAKHNTTCAPASLISIYNRGALSVFFFALGWVINIWWGMNKQASTLDCEPACCLPLDCELAEICKARRIYLATALLVCADKFVP